MFPISIILSLTVISLLLFAVAGWFWFPIWHKEQSGTAHGLFLTNAFMFLAALFKSFQLGSKLLGGEGEELPFNIVSTVLVALVAVVQFALSRGYFNFKEKKK